MLTADTRDLYIALCRTRREYIRAVRQGNEQRRAELSAIHQALSLCHRNIFNAAHGSTRFNGQHDPLHLGTRTYRRRQGQSLAGQITTNRDFWARMNN